MNSPPSGFVAILDPTLRAFVRSDFDPRELVQGLIAIEESVSVVGGGRASHPLLDIGDGIRLVVRRYHRGGLVRHFNQDRYFVGHRALRELSVTELARSRGVRVPEAIAAVERIEGLGYRALLATVWIEESVDFCAWSREGGARDQAVWRELGRQIGLLHRARIVHPDLNLRNLLLRRTDSAVFIIDFDRARRAAADLSPQRRTAVFRRLSRSARKQAVEIQTNCVEAVAEGYAEFWNDAASTTAPLGT